MPTLHSLADLRTLLTPEHDTLLDTVDRLAKLTQRDFETLVRNDIAGKTDPLDHDALRHPGLYQRWAHTLDAVLINVDGKLRDTTPDTWGGDYDDFKRRHTSFRDHVQRTIHEAQGLRHILAPKPSPEEKLTQRRQQGHYTQAAMQRLTTAHPREFTRYLVEEHTRADTSLPDDLYRDLRQQLDQEDQEPTRPDEVPDELAELGFDSLTCNDDGDVDVQDIRNLLAKVLPAYTLLLASLLDDAPVACVEHEGVCDCGTDMLATVTQLLRDTAKAGLSVLSPE